MERLAVRGLGKTQGDLLGFGRFDQGNGRLHALADIAGLGITQLNQYQASAGQSGGAVNVEQAGGLVCQVARLERLADQGGQRIFAGFEGGWQQHQQNIAFFMACALPCPKSAVQSS